MLRPDVFEIIHFVKKSVIENIAITTNEILFENSNIVKKINENLDDIP